MFKKLAISLVIASSLLSQSFAVLLDQLPSPSYCRDLALNITDLENKIKNGDNNFRIKVIDCLKQIETRSLIIPNFLDYDSNYTIELLKKSYNNFNNCFYFDVQNYGVPMRVMSVIPIDTPVGELTLDQVKYIDTNGDSNCLINTNTEKCRGKLLIEEQENPREYKKKRVFLYGCYGNEENPRYINNNQNSDVNSFSTFDEEKGFIASQAQKETLKKLSNNEAGPVIGFVNMIINYLVGIVFVLCMASLIYGGYNLIFAGFDSDMTEKGKNAIKYAITGFFLIMLSYTIVILVQSIF